MPQKIKEVRIGKKVVTVREMSVRQIASLVDMENSEPGKDENPDDFSISELATRLDTFLSMATDTSREELLEMYPSEVEEIWNGFREVNSSFLGLAGKLGKLGFDRLLKKFIPLVLDVIEVEIETSIKESLAQTSSPASASV